MLRLVKRVLTLAHSQLRLRHCLLIPIDSNGIIEKYLGPVYGVLLAQVEYGASLISFRTTRNVRDLLMTLRLTIDVYALNNLLAKIKAHVIFK